MLEARVPLIHDLKAWAAGEEKARNECKEERSPKRHPLHSSTSLLFTNLAPSTRCTPADMSLALNLDGGLLSRVGGALSDIRAGKMIVLVDDEDRENEGDLCMAAERVSAESINFMATHGRGLICLTLTEEQVEKLRLPMMRSPGRIGPALGTAFTVSIEARAGVTTGISAKDRAHTTRLAADPTTRPEDLVTPGHVFPLRARTGGVLVRSGQTEGSVDLARLAGLTPAGVICEIMNEDGSMARMRDLEVFSRKHGLRILAIADLIQYRLQTERLVTRLFERSIVLDQTRSEWRAIAYEFALQRRQFLALVKGDLDLEVATLCRVHDGSTLGDTFASTPQEGGRHLREAIRIIESEGRGVIAYLPPRGEMLAELQAYGPPAARAEPTREHTLCDFGLGAQMLVDLGLRKIRLLTNNPRKIAALNGYGLDGAEQVALLSNEMDAEGHPGGGRE